MPSTWPRCGPNTTSAWQYSHRHPCATPLLLASCWPSRCERVAQIALHHHLDKPQHRTLSGGFLTWDVTCATGSADTTAKADRLLFSGENVCRGAQPQNTADIEPGEQVITAASVLTTSRLRCLTLAG